MAISDLQVSVLIGFGWHINLSEFMPPEIYHMTPPMAYQPYHMAYQPGAGGIPYGGEDGRYGIPNGEMLGNAKRDGG
jgi:hypothetical protein